MLSQLGYSRLNAQRLQSHNSPLFLIHTHNIILRPRPLQLDPEHLNLSIPSLLHRVNDSLILRLKPLPLNLFDLLVAAKELLQIT
jgi:hypothetical protein